MCLGQSMKKLVIPPKSSKTKVFVQTNQPKAISFNNPLCIMGLSSFFFSRGTAQRTLNRSYNEEEKIGFCGWNMHKMNEAALTYDFLSVYLLLYSHIISPLTIFIIINHLFY